MRESGATFFARRKISYFCEVTTCFGISVAISWNLFGMTELVAGDEFEPRVEIEHAEEGMREAIRREISRFCFVEERESSFANSTEGGEHGIFFSEERRVDGKRRLKGVDAIFGQEKRESEALQERNWPRRMAKDAIRVGDDAGFDLAEMSDDFGGGPGVWGRGSLPTNQRDGVGAVRKRDWALKSLARRESRFGIRDPQPEENPRLTQMLRRRVEVVA